MNTAFRLLSKRKAPDAGGTYGVSFPGGAGNYLDAGAVVVNYDSVDWRVDMDMELGPNALAEIYGLFESGSNFFHRILNGKLQITSQGASIGTTTNTLPIGVKFNLKLERTGTSYFIYVDDVLFQTFSIPAAGKLIFRYVGKEPSLSSRTLIGKIYTLKVGTPAVPNQHEWVNTTGMGASWQNIGTLGAANLNFVGALTWVANP